MQLGQDAAFDWLKLADNRVVPVLIFGGPDEGDVAELVLALPLPWRGGFGTVGLSTTLIFSGQRSSSRVLSSRIQTKAKSSSAVPSGASAATNRLT